MACVVCGKNPRSILYCRRTDCPARAYTSGMDLPRPDVSVTTDANGKTEVTVSRPNGEGNPIGRKYEAEGPGMNEKIKNVVEKIVNDAYTAEWIPRK